MIRIIIALLLLPATAQAFPEKYYQDAWCAEHGGQTEVLLADGSRADCVTATHAIEVDFGSKVAEAIGQSLWYSIQTGKRAGIVLILKKPSDRKYLSRLTRIIEQLDLQIDVWEMQGGNRQKNAAIKLPKKTWNRKPACTKPFRGPSISRV